MVWLRFSFTSSKNLWQQHVTWLNCRNEKSIQRNHVTHSLSPTPFKSGSVRTRMQNSDINFSCWLFCAFCWCPLTYHWLSSRLPHLPVFRWHFANGPFFWRTTQYRTYCSFAAFSSWIIRTYLENSHGLALHTSAVRHVLLVTSFRWDWQHLLNA